MTKFAIGDVVTQKIVSRHGYISTGKVYAFDQSDPDAVVVEWDYGHMSKVKVSDLMTKEEAQRAKNQYEAEFLLVQERLRDRMKAVADLLKEANVLASSFGEEISEMHNITGDFISAVRVTGWNTSSWDC